MSDEQYARKPGRYTAADHSHYLQLNRNVDWPPFRLDKLAGNVPDWYNIFNTSVPLCQTHNKSSGSLEISDSMLFVSANVASTCW
jgi:hypothetical protein